MLPPQAISNVSEDRKSTRLNSSHTVTSYAVLCMLIYTQTQRTVSPGSSCTVAVRVPWSTVLGLQLWPSFQLFLSDCSPNADVPSFPTRRSSDLVGDRPPHAATICWPLTTESG